jgi:hypothetical protein
LLLIEKKGASMPSVSLQTISLIVVVSAILFLNKSKYAKRRHLSNHWAHLVPDDIRPLLKDRDWNLL